MRAVAIATTLVLLLAGCVGTQDESEPEPMSTATGVTVTDDRPDPTFSDVQVGTAAAPDTNATLEAAPKLQVGEWWRIQMESPLDGRSAEYVRVMAETTSEGYVFGMPHEGWYKEAVVYHVPFFGDVNLDLSGHAHDIPFLPLKFPLTDDQTWTTKFEGGPDLTATVKTDAAAKTAQVTFTNPNGAVVVDLTYDAKIHEITEFKHSTITYRVVDHGYDFEGWVTVPRGEDLIFFHGRIGPAIDLTLSPATPTDTIEIAGGFNRVSFILLVGDALNLGSAPGTYGVKATDPAGTVFEIPPTPMTSGLKIEFFESNAVDGTWTVDHLTGGAGATFIEGIAYHQYDIKVPTGEKRSDHSHEVVR